MKKEQQAYYNDVANRHFNESMQELSKCKDINCKRLRTCHAWVYETKNYFILKSYRTFIACIRKDNDTLYDVLRTEFGFTSTSCQHINKFGKDYGAGKWGCETVVTAR